MLRILHISSYIVLALSIVASAVVTMNRKGIGADVQEFLESPLTAERYKGNIPAGGIKDGSKSPLITQAEALSLRLNPPAPKVTTPNVRTQPGITAPPTAVRPTAPVVAKFDLLGTCVNESNPSLSMIYINIAGEGRKWVYEGETVGRLKIEQVKESSVVYSDGSNKNELSIAQTTSEIKSLLKSDNPEVVQTPAAPAAIGLPPAQRHLPARTTAPATTAIRAVPAPTPVIDQKQQKELLDASLKQMAEWKTGSEEEDKTLAEAMKNLEEMMKSAEKQ